MGAALADALNDGDLAAQLARGGIDSRAARSDDLDFAFETLRASMREYVAAAYGRWDDVEQRALFAPSFDLRTHRVIRSDDADAGILAVEVHVDRVQLARLFVLPRTQGRGLGGRVVEALLAFARARDLPLALTVLHANPRARRFYERHGFHAVGETSTHVHLEAEPSAARNC